MRRHTHFQLLAVLLMTLIGIVGCGKREIPASELAAAQAVAVEKQGQSQCTCTCTVAAPGG